MHEAKNHCIHVAYSAPNSLNKITLLHCNMPHYLFFHYSVKWNLYFKKIFCNLSDYFKSLVKYFADFLFHV